MATALPNLGKEMRYGDLKRRLLFLLGALVVFRIGAHIPVTGIDPNVLAGFFQNNQGGMLGMFNMFSGGALRRFTIFALGIMPYISASIIMQLMTAVSPQLDQLRKEGESGRRKITQYTRYGTVFLALFQSTGISIMLESQPNLVLDPGLMFRVTCVTTLVTGTMFLMWLGEQITERGLGNGISIIIFAGIAAGLPNAVAGTLELVRTGAMHPLTALLIAVAVVVVTGVVCFGSHEGLIWLRDLAGTLSPGQPIYVVLYGGLIVFFCFFYTALQYNPKETADNLKKSGAFVPGIRPGDQTARYLEKILTRLTLAGAVYVTLVCLLPEFLILKWNVPFYFGGTSLLIIVVVTMDFMSQVQAYIMTHQYESLLRKASFKGGLPVR